MNWHPHRKQLASKKAKSNDGRLSASRPKQAKSGSSNLKAAGDLKSPPELMGVATATNAPSDQPLSPSKTAARQMNKRKCEVVDLCDSDSDYSDCNDESE